MWEVIAGPGKRAREGARFTFGDGSLKAEVLQVLESCGICFEHLPSGIDTMSVIVNSADLEPVKELVINNICAAVEPDSINVEGGLALVAVVGRNMANATGTAARVCHAVARADINIRMIDQGSDEINIVLGVNEDDFEGAIKAIYARFVQ